MHAFSERYERANEHALKALRLSPFDPLNYHPYLALASIYLFTARFEEAVTYSTKAIQSNPGFSVMHAYLVASQVNLGRFEAARAGGPAAVGDCSSLHDRRFRADGLRAPSVDGRCSFRHCERPDCLNEFRALLLRPTSVKRAADHHERALSSCGPPLALVASLSLARLLRHLLRRRMSVGVATECGCSWPQAVRRAGRAI